MSQMFDAGGRVVPVTWVAVSPCVVTQVRTADKDGYSAVQFGGQGVRRKTTKPIAGHLKELPLVRAIREIRVDDASAWQRGAELTVAQFSPGDTITVVGISKGKGFQGVVKRHHFHGQDASHGVKDQYRMPGSIGGGGRNGKGRVIKGMRMAGRMGGDRVTVTGLKVVEIDTAGGKMALSGAIPGARGATLMIKAA